MTTAAKCTHVGTSLWAEYHTQYCLECGRSLTFYQLLSRPGFRSVGDVVQEDEIVDGGR